MDEYRRRNSLRLPGYNYANPAGVFITICTHKRQQLFGSVQNATVVPSDFGSLLANRWFQIPVAKPGVLIDEFIVMPDHLHGILWFGAVETDNVSTCSDVVQWLKIMTQRDISNAVRSGAPSYRAKLWQRGFYDRVIRNDRELEEIRFYINSNPVRWNRN